MSEYYFQKFPQINYNGANCVDITRRVSLATTDLTNLPTVFYAYDVPEGQRPDLTAYGYYEDSYMDWLIYMTNGIIDPMYDWYLTEFDFQSFMKDKYAEDGGVDIQQQRTKFYTNNWSNDDGTISPSFYANTIPEGAKKYYQAVFGQKGQVIKYARLEADWVADTNMIVAVQVANAAAYTNSDLCFMYSNGEQVGRCEIEQIYEANNTLFIRHVEANTEANILTTDTDWLDGLYLAGWFSEANQVIESNELIIEIIPLEEFSFWAPVSVYDWEKQKNSSKKSIYLLDPNYAVQAAEQLRVDLANNGAIA
jgi:hypothetical protein